MATVQEALLFAFDLHREGRLTEADTIYQRILDVAPGFPEALHLRGLILAEAGRLEEAAGHIDRAIAGNGAKADYHANLASILEALDRQDEAADRLTAAMALDSTKVESLNGFAARRLRQGQPDLAARILRDGVAAAPLLPELRYNLALALTRLGRDAEAAAQHRAGLLLVPDDASAARILSERLCALNREQDAMRILVRAVRLDPAQPDAWNLLGNRQKADSRLSEARRSYERGLSLAPGAAEMWNNRSSVLKGQGDLPGAVAALRRAHALFPDSPAILNNLADAFLLSGEAENALDAAEQALALAPELADARVIRAVALLSLERFAQGWAAWEDRWLAEPWSLFAARFPQPAWDGRPPASGQLLIWGEQGVGDEIQFAALVPSLTRAGIDCVLECDERLIPLFERSLPAVRLVARTTPPDPALLSPGIAAQCPSGSLPRFLLEDSGRFRLDPYLKADPERTATLRARCTAAAADALPSRPLLIGIAWHTTNPKQGRSRNLPLATLARSLNLPGVRMVVLQYGDWSGEVAALAKDGIDIRLPDAIDPWSDLDGLAAQIAATDLVVTIDNATAHMAGALGHPLWVLLPFAPNWRWLRDRADSPWYPSARLFRQPTPGDWRTPLQDVRDRLAAFVGRAPTA
ncbi:tetratricopeptide (TPR) repeat protein [Azospirillum agricola]|uniref:tetratricopeptide repeat protein n=1 Tax=Azospirillum agricola TaxID=1720247 RepID=UPI001AE32EB1|nr:tetratricopeptide repeat protein [Azospirillum agricola]MBP2227247.1 tetratricopeptide (TPR) repeat protein [Azospirillum agricola]